MAMPGRKYSAASGYRYGFNGKEKDNEVKGEGNSIDFGARIYDSRLGRWLSVDPKTSKYPMWSPFNADANDPINNTDPDGKEPIKPQAGTVSGFITFLNNTRTKMGTLTGGNAEDALRRLAEIKMDGIKPTPATTAPFNLQKDRYIYTEKGGWIDMSHFMFYAGRAYKYRMRKEELEKVANDPKVHPAQQGQAGARARNINPVGEAVQEGYQQEATDNVFASWSAYSYEDLPTDKFGADFATNYFDPNSKLTLGEQIQNYLNNNLKATTPDKAPNYNTLPTTEPTEEPSRKNYTTTPVFINGDKGEQKAKTKPKPPVDNSYDSRGARGFTF